MRPKNQTNLNRMSAQVDALIDAFQIIEVSPKTVIIDEGTVVIADCTRFVHMYFHPKKDLIAGHF